jgi:hypothetical protein
LERAQAAALLMTSGAAQADDVRDWFDWANLPDGDGQKSFMPINTQLLDMAGVQVDTAKQQLTNLKKPQPPPKTEPSPLAATSNPNPNGSAAAGQTPVQKKSVPATRREVTEALLDPSRGDLLDILLRLEEPAEYVNGHSDE